ncbi:collagen triple helix repeat protein, partial [Acidovorax delafieldii 2AN]
YGDGSAGALSVTSGQTLDLSTQAGFNSLNGHHHLQFTTISIAGTLKVPSGTVLRAMGDVTVGGSILVLPGTSDAAMGQPHPGIALAAAGLPQGGVGLPALAASLVKKPAAAAGGAGYVPNALNTGGNGGGALVVLAGGNVIVASGGSIDASGIGAQNTASSGDVPGAGGGAGGILVLAARGGITVSGLLRANGGAGSSAFNGNAGNTQGVGAGGGGGGGIIHFVASSSPSITGSVLANGGPAGFDQLLGTTALAGGGGGASGGTGGAGGAMILGISQPAQAGSAGYMFTTVVPAPENLFIY